MKYAVYELIGKCKLYFLPEDDKGYRQIIDERKMRKVGEFDCTGRLCARLWSPAAGNRSRQRNADYL